MGEAPRLLFFRGATVERKYKCKPYVELLSKAFPLPMAIKKWNWEVFGDLKFEGTSITGGDNLHGMLIAAK